METPVCDFVRAYGESEALRLHMPGHKGKPFLGMEQWDITEIEGADSLYEAGGILARSEANASELFGSATYYSTEGSSQCIRAMLYLALLYAKQTGRTPRIAAGRNAHKAFLSGAALLDLDVVWLYPSAEDSYLSCRLDARELEGILAGMEELPAAVYLTSPDYLGNIADIAAISAVCRRHQVLLLVDNAHGAYLRFLPESQHPMDLGADLCCDSAHKTLPVLTGGAYLHVCCGFSSAQVKRAMAMFGSTSPSYLILQSLDGANAYLEGYSGRLRAFLGEVRLLKEGLEEHGYQLYGSEMLKLTIRAKQYGYTGQELAQCLLRKEIVCEFADPDFLVLMLTPEIGRDGLKKLSDALLSIPKKAPVSRCAPRFHRAERVLSIRDAAFSAMEILPVEQCVGRILGDASVGCPPAVPILVCGERIDEHAIQCFQYYGIHSCAVCVENSPPLDMRMSVSTASF